MLCLYLYRIDENTYLKHKRMKVYSLETNSVVKRKWYDLILK